jgi:hypothetical protein
MSIIDKGVSSLPLVGNFSGYCEKLKSMPNEARLGLQNTNRGRSDEYVSVFGAMMATNVLKTPAGCQGLKGRF